MDKDYKAIEQRLFVNANRRVKFDCFWSSGCSDSKRCNEHGSCVAAAQNVAARKPLKPSDALLLPCPFCGQAAMLEEVADRASSNPGSVRFSVGCKIEECIGYMSVSSYPRRRDAIKAWNTRPKYDPTLPMAEDGTFND